MPLRIFTMHSPMCKPLVSKLIQSLKMFWISDDRLPARVPCKQVSRESLQNNDEQVNNKKKTNHYMKTKKEKVIIKTIRPSLIKSEKSVI